MKKYALFGLAALILFMGYSITSTEGYFHPYPYIDTRLSKNFSWKNYEDINRGMTKNNVQSLLGDPLDSFSAIGGNFGIKEGELDPINNALSVAGQSQSLHSECWQYSTDGGTYAFWDFAWISVNVCFDEDGNVKNKNQTIFYD